MMRLRRLQEMLWLIVSRLGVTLLICLAMVRMRGLICHNTGLSRMDVLVNFEVISEIGVVTVVQSTNQQLSLKSSKEPSSLLIRNTMLDYFLFVLSVSLSNPIPYNEST